MKAHRLDCKNTMEHVEKNPVFDQYTRDKLPAAQVAESRQNEITSQKTFKV